jgi:hypothetical protein
VPTEFGMLAIAGVAFFTFFGFLIFLGWFAREHSDLAATEGPTYVQSRQLTLGAKSIPSPQNTQLGPDPQNPTLLGPAAE